MLTGEPLFPGDSDIDQLYHIVKVFGKNIFGSTGIAIFQERWRKSCLKINFVSREVKNYFHTCFESIIFTQNIQT